MRNTISKQLNNSSGKFTGGISRWSQFFRDVYLHQSEVPSLVSPTWNNDSSATTCWKGELPERYLEREFHFSTAPVRKTLKGLILPSSWALTEKAGLENHTTEKMWRGEDKNSLQHFGWRRGENVRKGGMGVWEKCDKGRWCKLKRGLETGVHFSTWTPNPALREKGEEKGTLGHSTSGCGWYDDDRYYKDLPSDLQVADVFSTTCYNITCKKGIRQ